MNTKTFIKILSANDVGATGSHMAGIAIPKGDGELLSFLPKLDSSNLNPSAWIDCEIQDGLTLKLRYIYYNNRMHSPTGTRNEYRITHLTKFLRDSNAKEGDYFEISKQDGANHYQIRVIANDPMKQKGAEHASAPKKVLVPVEPKTEHAPAPKKVLVPVEPKVVANVQLQNDANEAVELTDVDQSPVRIKLTSGWSRVH